MKQKFLIVSEKAKQFTKILQTKSETFIAIPESQVLKNVSLFQSHKCFSIIKVLLCFSITKIVTLQRVLLLA